MPRRSPPIIIAGPDFWRPVREAPSSMPKAEYDKLYDRCQRALQMHKAQQEGRFQGAMAVALLALLFVGALMAYDSAKRSLCAPPVPVTATG